MHTLSSILQVFCKPWLRMVHRDSRVSINNRDRVEVFLARFHPRGGLLLTKKMAALSLSLSPILLHFRFRSRDRDARCSDAYRAPACFFARFLSPYPNDLPLFTSAEGVVSFARGEKEGRSSSLCSLPFRSG